MKKSNLITAALTYMKTRSIEANCALEANKSFLLYFPGVYFPVRRSGRKLIPCKNVNDRNENA